MRAILITLLIATPIFTDSLKDTGAQCTPGCALCLPDPSNPSTSSQCHLCFNKKLENGQCSSSTVESNCLFYSNRGCEICSRGYTLFSGSYICSSDVRIQNCGVFGLREGQPSCLACWDGRGPSQDMRQCVEGEKFKNCKIGVVGGCFACQKGYYSNENLECVEASKAPIQGCMNTDITRKEKYCKLCNVFEGWYDAVGTFGQRNCKKM